MHWLSAQLPSPCPQHVLRASMAGCTDGLRQVQLAPSRGWHGRQEIAEGLGKKVSSVMSQSRKVLSWIPWAFQADYRG